MKTLVVVRLIAILACGITVAAEDKTWPSNPQSPVAPWTLAEAAMIGQFVGYSWALTVVYEKPEYPILDRDTFVAQLRAVASKSPEKDGREDNAANQKLLNARMDLVTAALRAVPGVAGESLVALIGEPEVRTVLFARRGDTRCLVIPNVGVRTVMDTLRTEPKERATKIATTVALPTLRAIAKLSGFDGAGIKCIGVGVIYGAKSFDGGPGRASMTEPEFVLAAGQLSDIRAFAAGELAEEELLGRLDVFAQDRSMVAEVKKILLGVRP